MTASVTVPHWLSPQIVRKSQKRQVVNCCEEERQAGLFQVVSYDLWMQNVQLSVAWISKPLKYVTKKGRCMFASSINLNLIERNMYWDHSFRHWKLRRCLVWRTSWRVIVEMLSCALYKCIGSMHRTVIGVWMMSVGYDEVSIVQKTVPGTHASLSSCTSYCSVLLNVLLLFAFATKEWLSVFFERMVTLSTSPVSDALGPQACQQMDNT